MKVPLLGKNTACDLEYSDYHDVAAAFGARGFLLDRDNDSEEENVKIQRTLAEAMEASSRDKKAVLINALIGTTDFRQGSLSV